MSKEPPSSGPQRVRRLFGLLRLAVIVMGTAALVPVAYAGWRELYTRFLEKTGPTIEQAETFPRGIGLAPVSYRFSVKDEGAGLDEVVVRVRQKARLQEVVRRPLNGKPFALVVVNFPDPRLTLEEGKATLEVKVFDKSFWSNKTEQSLEITVDYRKPTLEVLTSQHNAVLGGSQLILYKAYDENLAFSGVKVGSRVFEGFPAKGLDPAFANYHAVYGAIYAIPAETDPKHAVRLLAEDAVGNAASLSFNNRISRRQWHAVVFDLKEPFLRGQVAAVLERNLSKLQAHHRSAGEKIEYHSSSASPERLIENFQLVNQKLRAIGRDEMEGMTGGKRFEQLWQGAFMLQSGAPQLAYGQEVLYRHGDQQVGRAFQEGYDIRISRQDRAVIAANDGIIAFSDEIGIYGRVVGIDHGFGLFTVYGQLDGVNVQRGESVTAGQMIGLAGRSGLARGPDAYFEMRVQGVPVDAREWWDKRWYFEHIQEKIEEVKKVLGLQVYQPFK
jgi:murein DD-endopeptidase MepM/ murein hydrolase activator NlpD